MPDLVKGFRPRHPTFQRTFGRAEEEGRLDVRWTAGWRDLQIQLQPRVSQSEAALSKAAREDGSWFRARNWIAVNVFHNPTSTKK